MAAAGASYGGRRGAGVISLGHGEPGRGTGVAFCGAGSLTRGNAGRILDGGLT